MRLLVTLSLLFFCVVVDAENILVRDAPTLEIAFWSGAGSAIVSGVGSLLGGLFGNSSSSKNIDKQLAAQAEENQKTREYNLQLAQMQNAWNVEQWERENDYNTPANQLERMKAAGMNPDLAVANGYSNTSASSPQMTSGAAATAQDMSALGQKPTLGQAIQSALRDSMIGAQIDNIKANTRKTNADAGISESTAKYLDAEKELGIKINERVYEKLEHEIDKAFEDAQAAGYLVEKLNQEAIQNRIKSQFTQREMEAIVKRLENEAKISEQDAKLSIESYFYRFLGIKSEAQLKQFNAQLPEQLESLFGENAGYAALVLQGVQFLLGNANNIATFAGQNKQQHNHTHNTYNNTYVRR